MLTALALGAEAQQQTFTVSVSNPLATVRTDQPVVISLAPYGDIRSALVTTNGQEIPCQLDDLDQDETFDELCFLADLKGKETKPYEVTLLSEGEPRSYPARVYADMLLRYQDTMQSWSRFQDDYRLNDAELAYYLDASVRIEKMLLDVK